MKRISFSLFLLVSGITSFAQKQKADLVIKDVTTSGASGQYFARAFI